MSTAANPYASPQTSDLARDSDAAPVNPPIFAFSGRLGRMRMFAYVFVTSLLAMPLAFLSMGLMFSGSASGALLYFAVLIVSTVYSISLYVRRLHDLDQSGWWSLLFLVPLANIGLLIYMFFFRGSAGENRYGAPTTPNSGGVKATFIAGLVVMVALPFLAAISMPAYMDYVQRAQQAQMQQ